MDKDNIKFNLVRAEIELTIAIDDLKRMSKEFIYEGLSSKVIESKFESLKRIDYDLGQLANNLNFKYISSINNIDTIHRLIAEGLHSDALNTTVYLTQGFVSSIKVILNHMEE